MNLEEEIRNGFLIDKKMKKVWRVELDLLTKLSEVCEKYNLKFYADAGTLLGAVRHKGFIPWDDDIDVAMFRGDYDKLLEIGDKEFKHPYFLQTTYSDKNYVRGHAQLRNSNTTAILLEEQKDSKDIKYNQGIFIDIFVLDAVVEDKKKLEKQKRKIELRKKILNSYIYQNDDNITFKRKMIRPFLNIYFKIFSYKKVFKKTEDILRKNKIEEHQFIAPLNFKFETEKRIRDKNIYNKVIMLDFEDKKIPAPSGYDEFLTKRYGDYMKPVNNPTTHGEYAILDPDKSYVEYRSV